MMQLSSLMTGGVPEGGEELQGRNRGPGMESGIVPKNRESWQGRGGA